MVVASNTGASVSDVVPATVNDPAENSPSDAAYCDSILLSISRPKKYAIVHSPSCAPFDIGIDVSYLSVAAL